MTIAARFSPSPGHPGIGLSGLIPDPRARVAVSLAGLGVSLWSAAGELPQRPGTAPLAALAIAAVAWLVLAAMTRGPLVAAAVVVLGAAGGVITVTDQSGLIFAGLSAGIAAVTFDSLAAPVLAAAGPAAFAATAALTDALPGRLLAIVAACLVAMVAGASRRESVQRARQATLVATARQRAEVSREQAELARERIRLGRELHDVLAHTLGALSIQITALDTMVRKGTGPEELLAEIGRGHQLVSAGLDDARQAVRALRDDATPLADQLERLCALHGAGLEVAGTPRPLGAGARLVLYRAAQEALTNAARHAPGSGVSVLLSFGEEEVTMSVRNTRPCPPTGRDLPGAGGGYGLPGMRERVLQAGGRLEAGPGGDGGWQVTARIPA
jgi:signal transduction histidine kinase